MDGDCGYAKLLRGAKDAKRDFAAIGDQDLFEHLVLILCRRLRCGAWRGVRAPAGVRRSRAAPALLTGCEILDQDGGDGAGLVRDDVVEGLHRLDQQNFLDFLDMRPDLDEGLSSGLGRR